MPLLTGKKHVSYSEIKEYRECGFRHKLRQIDKIDLSKPSIHLVFGTATHAVAENYFNSGGIIDLEIARKILDDEWIKNADYPDFISNDKEAILKSIQKIMNDLPDFLKENFPGWVLHRAEEDLYENIGPFLEQHADVSFKGFIDVVLKVPGKRDGEFFYWIVDFKTANRPWNRDKIQDENVKMQLVLYKNFWAKKNNVPLKSIRCGFVTLLKNGKPGNLCKLIPVSVGDVTSERSLKVLNSAVTGIKKGLALKNRNSCKYCDYYNTQHCKLT